MFKSLRTKNFRTHKDTVLDFSKGVNVILGMSQSGKTNCTFRGINLLKDNRPSSASFFPKFSNKGGSTVVELETYEGSVLSITKNVEKKKDKETGKRGNSLLSTEYMHNGRVKPFEGVGRDVPDEIRDILNLSEINIQDQNDKHFLITDTPGEVARTINRITKLEQADEWIRDLTSRVNSANKEAVTLDTDIKKVEVELLRYDNLEQVGDYIDRAVKLDDGVQKYDREVYEVSEILGKLDDVIEGIELLGNVLGAEEYLHKANDIEGSINDCESELGIILEYTNVCNDYLEIEQIGVELKGDLEIIKGYYDKVHTFDDNIEALKGEYELIANYINVDKEESGLLIALDKDRDRLNTLLKSMGKCPMCFGDIDDKCIKRIMKEI